MSGLLRNPVNPLNANASAPASAQVIDLDGTAEVIDQQNCLQVVPEDPDATSVNSVVSRVVSEPVESDDDDGFGTLQTVSYGGYPRVKLEGGQFWIDDEPLGSEFLAHLLRTKKAFLYVLDGAGDRSTKDPQFWTLDKITTTEGESVAATVRQWEASGRGTVKVKPYSNVLALIMSGPHKDKFVICSIPKTGTDRLFAYNNTLLVRDRLKASQVLTRVYAGAKVQFTGGSFIPWCFERAGDLPQHLLAAAA